ncbi:peptidoglycan-binding protein [Cellulomonas fimi]|uniref:Peptidoglycan-binding protein n=1 Tax=Cellulomonas fimi TaxID=1708 RepID=A0A7Y0M050_CELFI|nr:peptidoglycan-binding protein [Cellulomonas fimi]NMR21398.1 peptidoglycan-binding protein [Cellulomonas fimi]
MTAPDGRRPVSRRAFLVVTGAAAASVLAACTEEPQAPAPTGARSPGRTTPSSPGRWQSELVSVTDGRLAYRHDDGLRIPDFGQAGYGGGGRPLPDVPAARTIEPIDGDNTAHLQRALDAVGALPLGDRGVRGALVLAPGTYTLAGTLRLDRSGVVLRGAGDGTDPSTATILRAVGDDPPERDVVVVGGEGDGEREVRGTRTDITSDVVPVAAASFAVADVAGLRPGTPVVVVHPCSERWLDAVDHGGTGRDERWEVGSLPIVYHRRITDVAGDVVTLDVPVFTTLDRSLSQSRLSVRDRSGLVTDVGVEDLRLDIAATAADDERHAKNGIRLRLVEDAWVRRCTVVHFTQAGVVTTNAHRVTVVDCRALEPAARTTGGRRYNFNADRGSQQVLFTGCHAEGGRHAYVSNGTSSVSGVVFHRTTATGSLASSEGHRRWSQGLLFDIHRELAPATDRTLGLYNRGDYGTGHGWSAVHSVAWACDVGDSRLVVQRPPTAQNYAVGCVGDVTGDGPFDGPEGHAEGTGRPGLEPASLYEAQLAARTR